MLKRRWLPLALILLLVVAVAGCSPSVVQESKSVAPAQSMDYAVEAPAPEADFGGERGTAATVAESAYQEGAAERMIIRTVNMSLVVEDTEKVLKDLNALVKAHDGYIANSNSWHSNDQLYANVTLRVPAEDLDTVLEAVRGMVIAVDSESLSGQDVTEEYTDLQARLRNLEATEKELQALLTEVRENRGDAEEILAIYRELTTIRGEIESMEGRAQYLERMTALATIQMDIRPKEAPVQVTSQRWSPLVTLSEALRGLLNFLTVLADVGIYLLIFSPIVLVPVLVIWLIARAVRKRRNRNKAAIA
ncbi:MAG: DUF4349 domain-containing protein [Anaerolineae bacterium]